MDCLNAAPQQIATTTIDERIIRIPEQISNRNSSAQLLLHSQKYQLEEHAQSQQFSLHSTSPYQTHTESLLTPKNEQTPQPTKSPLSTDQTLITHSNKGNTEKQEGYSTQEKVDHQQEGDSHNEEGKKCSMSEVAECGVGSEMSSTSNLCEFIYDDDNSSDSCIEDCVKEFRLTQADEPATTAAHHLAPPNFTRKNSSAVLQAAKAPLNSNKIYTDHQPKLFVGTSTEQQTKQDQYSQQQQQPQKIVRKSTPAFAAANKQSKSLNQNPLQSHKSNALPHRLIEEGDAADRKNNNLDNPSEDSFEDVARESHHQNTFESLSFNAGIGRDQQLESGSAPVDCTFDDGVLSCASSEETKQIQDESSQVRIQTREIVGGQKEHTTSINNITHSQILIRQQEVRFPALSPSPDIRHKTSTNSSPSPNRNQKKQQKEIPQIKQQKLLSSPKSPDSQENNKKKKRKRTKSIVEYELEARDQEKNENEDLAYSFRQNRSNTRPTQISHSSMANYNNNNNKNSNKNNSNNINNNKTTQFLKHDKLYSFKRTPTTEISPSNLEILPHTIPAHENHNNHNSSNPATSFKRAFSSVNESIDQSQYQIQQSFPLISNVSLQPSSSSNNNINNNNSNNTHSQATNYSKLKKQCSGDSSQLLNQLVSHPSQAEILATISHSQQLRSKHLRSSNHSISSGNKKNHLNSIQMSAAQQSHTHLTTQTLEPSIRTIINRASANTNANLKEISISTSSAMNPFHLHLSNGGLNNNNNNNNNGQVSAATAAITKASASISFSEALNSIAQTMPPIMRYGDSNPSYLNYNITNLYNNNNHNTSFITYSSSNRFSPSRRLGSYSEHISAAAAQGVSLTSRQLAAGPSVGAPLQSIQQQNSFLKKQQNSLMSQNATALNSNYSSIQQQPSQSYTSQQSQSMSSQAPPLLSSRRNTARQSQMRSPRMAISQLSNTRSTHRDQNAWNSSSNQNSHSYHQSNSLKQHTSVNATLISKSSIEQNASRYRSHKQPQQHQQQHEQKRNHSVNQLNVCGMNLSTNLSSQANTMDLTMERTSTIGFKDIHFTTTTATMADIAAISNYQSQQQQLPIYLSEQQQQYQQTLKVQQQHHHPTTTTKKVNLKSYQQQHISHPTTSMTSTATTNTLLTMSPKLAHMKENRQIYIRSRTGMSVVESGGASNVAAASISQSGEQSNVNYRRQHSFAQQQSYSSSQHPQSVLQNQSTFLDENSVIVFDENNNNNNNEQSELEYLNRNPSHVQAHQMQYSINQQANNMISYSTNTPSRYLNQNQNHSHSHSHGNNRTTTTITQKTGGKNLTSEFERMKRQAGQQQQAQQKGGVMHSQNASNNNNSSMMSMPSQRQYYRGGVTSQKYAPAESTSSPSHSKKQNSSFVVRGSQTINDSQTATNSGGKKCTTTTSSNSQSKHRYNSSVDASNLNKYLKTQPPQTYCETIRGMQIVSTSIPAAASATDHQQFNENANNNNNNNNKLSASSCLSNRQSTASQPNSKSLLHSGASALSVVAAAAVQTTATVTSTKKLQSGVLSHVNAHESSNEISITWIPQEQPVNLSISSNINSNNNNNNNGVNVSKNTQQMRIPSIPLSRVTRAISTRSSRPQESGVLSSVAAPAQGNPGMHQPQSLLAAAVSSNTARKGTNFLYPFQGKTPNEFKNRSFQIRL